MAVCLCVGGSAVVAFLGQSDPNIMDQSVVVNGSINITGFDWNASSSSVFLSPESSSDENTFGPIIGQVGVDGASHGYGTGNGTKVPSKYGVASIVSIPPANATTKNSSITWCVANCNTLSSCDAITVHTANSTCARYTCTAACSVPNVTSAVVSDFSELVRAASEENTAGGYAWCLGSVVLYAAYEVVYKKYVTLMTHRHDTDDSSSSFFLGVLTRGHI